MLKTMIVIGTVLLAGCAVGRNIKKVPAAVTHTGVEGWVAVDGTRHRGEVLSVSDSSIVLLVAPHRLIAVPVARIERLDFGPFVAHDEQVTQGELVRLRQASRFPFGIPDEVLAGLLARSSQTAIETLP